MQSALAPACCDVRLQRFFCTPRHILWMCYCAVIMLARLAAWPRKLYDWTLRWADTPYGTPALFVLAFAEASFFPIPPDILLMALCLSKPRRAFLYAAVCTLGSVLGAALGWVIGYLLWSSLGTHPECTNYQGGAWLFQHIPGFSCENFGKIEKLFRGNVWLALLLAAFTPIPFKVFTVASGVFKLSLPAVLAASALGRAGRFTLVAGLIFAFGPAIRRFLEKHFEWMTLIFSALILGGFMLVKTFH